jgi:hypothetical protein
MLVLSLASLEQHPAAAQPFDELRLWPDGASGSEDWIIPETVTTSPAGLAGGQLDRPAARLADRA